MAAKSSCAICGSSALDSAFTVRRRTYIQCRRCGLFLVERIRDTEVKDVYTSNAYHREHVGHRLELREALFQRSLDECDQELGGPGRLLDVGCGDGLFLSLARARGWDTYGVELSRADWEHAVRELRLPVVLGELKSARFPDGFFDVVTLHNVLDHLPSPLEELREAHRVLRYGGLLVLRVPNAAFHATLVRLLPVLERYLVFHLYCFSPSSISHALHTAGYDRVVINNAPLTPGDPYGIFPLLGERGMQLIKMIVYAAVQSVSSLTHHRLLLGPSLSVRARKPMAARI